MLTTLILRGGNFSCRFGDFMGARILGEGEGSGGENLCTVVQLV